MQGKIVIPIWVTLVFILIIPLCLHSEIYNDIGPLDTLDDVKAKFPQAILRKCNPAWAQESDIMYFLSGEGLLGTTIIVFKDSRPGWRNYQKTGEGFYADMAKELADAWANQSEGKALTVQWVRWQPDNPIPLKRYIHKYGKPDISGFTDEAMQPYRQWTKRGLAVILTNDEKKVECADFYFTKEERKRSYKAKYNTIPK